MAVAGVAANFGENVVRKLCPGGGGRAGSLLSDAGLKAPTPDARRGGWYALRRRSVRRGVSPCALLVPGADAAASVCPHVQVR